MNQAESEAKLVEPHPRQQQQRWKLHSIETLVSHSPAHLTLCPPNAVVLLTQTYLSLSLSLTAAFIQTKILSLSVSLSHRDMRYPLSRKLDTLSFLLSRFSLHNLSLSLSYSSSTLSSLPTYSHKQTAFTFKRGIGDSGNTFSITDRPDYVKSKATIYDNHPPSFKL